MSAERDGDGLEIELEALLGDVRARDEARARLAASPDGAERLDALARALDAAGEELRSTALPHPARHARFVAHVLARTTRQDPSWRGDLRLALDFLRGRLRASPALRLVAALLALQLVAAPAVALLVALRREEPAPFTIRVELPRDEPFPEPTEPAPGAVDELAAAARRREARENAFARERWVLGAAGASAPVVAARADVSDARSEAPVELALLDARAALLRTRALAGAPDTLSGDPAVLEPLALALWTELALDRLVLLGEEDAALGRAAQRLAGLEPERSAGPGTATLVRAAVRRAAALGVLEPSAAHDAAPGTLAPAWFEALARAAEEHGLGASSVVTAWTEWGSRGR